MEENKNNIETLEEKNNPSKAKKKTPYRKNYRKNTLKNLETEKKEKNTKTTKTSKGK